MLSLLPTQRLTLSQKKQNKKDTSGPRKQRKRAQRPLSKECAGQGKAISEVSPKKKGWSTKAVNWEKGGGEKTTAKIQPTNHQGHADVQTQTNAPLNPGKGKARAEDASDMWAVCLSHLNISVGSVRCVKKKMASSRITPGQKGGVHNQTEGRILAAHVTLWPP